jgi:hypothetical protein
MARGELLSLTALEARLHEIGRSPLTDGPVELIVRRPAPLQRETLDEAELDPDDGLVGDCWRSRGSRSTPDGGAHPGMQLTLMSSRAAEVIAGGRDRWALAGDQLYVDLDLSEANLPAGTLLTLGTATIEVTGAPHTGCQKFKERFGGDALRFVNTRDGRALRLRGMNTRVVVGGTVRVGDLVVPSR